MTITVDDPLVMDANYRFDAADRRKIDNQILTLQRAALSLESYGYGFVVVSDATERNAIASDLREEGMHAFCVDVQTTYRLVGGITNDKWVVATGAGVPQSLVWKPGVASGNGHVQAWAEVEAWIAASEQPAPLLLYCDDAENPGWLLEIPATADTDLLGKVWFIAANPRPHEGTTYIWCADGGRVRNPAGFIGVSPWNMSTAVIPWVLGGINAAPAIDTVTLRDSVWSYEESGATVPTYSIATGSKVVITVDGEANFDSADADVAHIRLLAGSELTIQFRSSNLIPGTIPANLVEGDGTTTLYPMLTAEAIWQAQTFFTGALSVLRISYAKALAFPAQQTLFVDKSGSDTTNLGDGSYYRPFLTIAAALAAITDASSSKPYVVRVGPGLFSDAFALKPWIWIVGASSAAPDSVGTPFGATALSGAITFTADWNTGNPTLHHGGIDRCFLAKAGGHTFDLSGVTYVGRFALVDCASAYDISLIGSANTKFTTQNLRFQAASGYKLTVAGGAFHNFGLHLTDGTLEVSGASANTSATISASSVAYVALAGTVNLAQLDAYASEIQGVEADGANAVFRPQGPFSGYYIPTNSAAKHIVRRYSASSRAAHFECVPIDAQTTTGAASQVIHDGGTAKPFGLGAMTDDTIVEVRDFITVRKPSTADGGTVEITSTWIRNGGAASQLGSSIVVYNLSGTTLDGTTFAHAANSNKIELRVSPETAETLNYTIERTWREAVG